MATVHFLNVLEGDCSIIQHDSGRVSVIDVSNAYNGEDTEEEKKVKKIKNTVVKNNNYVPDGKINYRMKELPDNPIDYLRKLKVQNIFRFIITHPDMDHLDGIKDLFTEFTVVNTWDTDNNKALDLKNFSTQYNPDDWKFYTDLRDGKYENTKRLTYYSGNTNSYYKEDNIEILSPTPELVKQANEEGGDIHDLSYVLLFTHPKEGGGTWKIIFAGDSHDNSWENILKQHKEDVTNIDVLFAPHHGRDSNRSYAFLDILKPKLTLFGNASNEHLAYSSYRKTRITNNQAGHVVINITNERILVLVENKAFADNYRNKKKRKWGEASYYDEFDAYGLFQFSAK